jgi:tripartite-type tricarboxylate transporter receptor subunit TctC
MTDSREARRRPWRFAAAVGLGLACSTAPSLRPQVERAFAKAPLYAGKQIELAIASGPGGGYDVYARVLATHLADHIPGRPAIVPENMPGAAGLLAMNWAANVAPRDGTAMVATFNAALAGPLFGQAGAKFDPRKLVSIGSIGTLQNICATWHTSRIKTIADAKTHSVSVAAEGANSNSATLPAILNHMLGTKFHVIMGYSTGDMRLALERGEVEGICGLGWSTLQASDPEWIADHRLNILLQTGEKGQPGLEAAPLLVDLAPTEQDKEILRALEFPEGLGRPYFMPPGTPPGMVDVMRAAFDATMKDPAFLADAKRAKLDVDPVSGADMARIIARAYATPPALIKAAAPFSGVTTQ